MTASSPLMETRTKLSGKANPFNSLSEGSWAAVDSSTGSVGSWANGQLFVAIPLPTASAYNWPASTPFAADDQGTSSSPQAGDFKLGDFRSKLLQRAKTLGLQASQASPEIPLRSVETSSLECSSCKGFRPEPLMAPHATSERCQCVEHLQPSEPQESKGVPAVPLQHAAAFQDRTPSKKDSREEDCLPVKHTFIHFPDCDGPEDSGFQWSSTPPIMMTGEHHTKYPGMEAAHIRGECHPCFYNIKKSDGCRKGADCEFCHLCPAGSVQKKRKERVNAMRKQELLDKQVDSRRLRRAGYGRIDSRT